MLLMQFVDAIAIAAAKIDLVVVFCLIISTPIMMSSLPVSKFGIAYCAAVSNVLQTETQMS